MSQHLLIGTSHRECSRTSICTVHALAYCSPPPLAGDHRHFVSNRCCPKRAHLFFGGTLYCLESKEKEESPVQLKTARRVIILKCRSLPVPTA